MPRPGFREVVYQNPHQQVYRVEADVGGLRKQYFVTDYGHRAGVVVAKEGEVLFVRQYRLLIDRVSWEIPGGRVNAAETPQQAAIRECLEETGVHCRDLEPLLLYHPGLDTLHNPTHLFYTHTFVVDAGPQVAHGHEVEGHEWVPLDRCIEMIFRREIVDSFSIIALLAYQTVRRRRNGSL